MRDTTVVIFGLGDLGIRVAELLARLPLGRLVVAARDPAVGRAVAGQATVIAGLTDGTRRVDARVLDLRDVAATAALLAETQPQVAVVAASRHTWWRTPSALAGVPYGAWLPLQAQLTRNAVQARDDAGCSTKVVGLAYPDAVGPFLAGAGVAPDAGAGNVAEIAAKLRHAVARTRNAPLAEVRVRLIAHHAVERLAFSAFDILGSDEDADRPGPPPFLADATVAGEPLERAELRDLLLAPHPLRTGRETHVVTATATAALVTALLGAHETEAHVPAPAGRCGGYPVFASAAGMRLDLPADVSESHATAVNATAARWDGIERIAADGTVTWTRTASRSMRERLGVADLHLRPADLDAAADALADRLADHR